ncbi:MAG: SipW-dependent-type signal peptide-containing protein [Oscillospiraceae bacterium]|nr:SipW-dependent-type signal peptide-containing protein [Oscillospiraceae bacterium]
MKNAKKILALLLCAVLLVGASIAGTVAYLTSKDEVTNTFTVGKVQITLDETDVDVNGVKDSETRVKENTYKLIPGHTYVKDPVVHVDAESENCFLYIKVENQIAGIEAATTIADQLAANGWSLVTDKTNVYTYKEVCGAGYNIPTFTQFKVKEDVQDLSAYNGLFVKVTAYAVQHDGFASADAAWEATFGA